MAFGACHKCEPYVFQVNEPKPLPDNTDWSVDLSQDCWANKDVHVQGELLFGPANEHLTWTVHEVRLIASINGKDSTIASSYRSQATFKPLNISVDRVLHADAGGFFRLAIHYDRFECAECAQGIPFYLEKGTKLTGTVVR